jgi:hypothetical protein
MITVWQNEASGKNKTTKTMKRLLINYALR